MTRLFVWLYGLAVPILLVIGMSLLNVVLANGHATPQQILVVAAPFLAAALAAWRFILYTRGRRVGPIRVVIGVLVLLAGAWLMTGPVLAITHMAGPVPPKATGGLAYEATLAIFLILGGAYALTGGKAAAPAPSVSEPTE